MSQSTLPHDHGEQVSALLEHLPSPAEFQSVSDIYRLLGDESRLRIFWVLCHCEECVINLSAMVGMSSPAVSHHLRQLRSGGLIVSHRKGKEVYYKAADTSHVQDLHENLEKLISIACPASGKSRI